MSAMCVFRIFDEFRHTPHSHFKLLCHSMLSCWDAVACISVELKSVIEITIWNPAGNSPLHINSPNAARNTTQAIHFQREVPQLSFIIMMFLLTLTPRVHSWSQLVWSIQYTLLFRHPVIDMNMLNWQPGLWLMIMMSSVESNV